MDAELRHILMQDERYKDFIILEEPVKFSVMMAGRNMDVVQTHSVQKIELEDYQSIVGFCGQFSWKDGTLTPLDGDSYNPDVMVLGYEYWSTDDVPSGMDILVGNDW